MCELSVKPGIAEHAHGARIHRLGGFRPASARRMDAGELYASVRLPVEKAVLCGLKESNAFSPRAPSGLGLALVRPLEGTGFSGLFMLFFPSLAGAAVKNSKDRILTTHVGSLPRSLGRDRCRVRQARGPISLDS